MNDLISNQRCRRCLLWVTDEGCGCRWSKEWQAEKKRADALAEELARERERADFESRLNVRKQEYLDKQSEWFGIYESLLRTLWRSRRTWQAVADEMEKSLRLARANARMWINEVRRLEAALADESQRTLVAGLKATLANAAHLTEARAWAAWFAAERDYFDDAEKELRIDLEDRAEAADAKLTEIRELCQRLEHSQVSRTILTEILGDE